MINNLLEVWYWTLMLGAMAGFAIYLVFCLLRNVWTAIKKRKIESSEDL